jgi:hypothetical protein
MSSRTRNIVLGCVGILLAGICLCGGGAIFLADQGIEALLGFAQDIVTAPYGIADRPLPSSPLRDDLLPASVGPYNRLPEEVLPGNVAQAVYDVNGSRVQVQAARYPSVEAAQSQVRLFSDADYSGTRTYVTGLDPSYMRLYANDDTGRMVWSHGAYYFDVLAPSHGALDSFMEAFPY